MAQPFQIPAGTTIRFGAPARPLAEDIRNGIKSGLSSIAGVSEAHLPLCQVMGSMPEPAQVLVVVFKNRSTLEPAMPSLLQLVRNVIPQDSHLDIWPLVENDPLLDTIRKANCYLFRAVAPRPWWKP